jgi:glycosyltransferase involved in cell wall biosynthesis
MGEKSAPLISVVTVCFNSEMTIENTILSVLSQEFQDFEHIIIDGQSTDSTLQIIQKYQHYPNLKCYSEKDKGIYDAMNKGLQKANGKFIHFLNADDVLLSPSIYRTVAEKLKDESTLYHAKLKYIHRDGRVRILGHPIQKNDLRFGLKGIHQPATFFSRRNFQNYGLFDLKYRISADYDLIRRFCSKEKTFFIDEVVVAMSDGGASALLEQTAYFENRDIAVSYGEHMWHILIREYRTRIGMYLRNKWPSIFHVIFKMKQKLERHSGVAL